MRRRQPAPSVRITSASRPHSEDLGGRQRRYLISMAIRTISFVLAVVFMGHWSSWVFLVAAVFLPYVAVVLANAGASPDPGRNEFGYQPDLRAISEQPSGDDR